MTAQEKEHSCSPFLFESGFWEEIGDLSNGVTEESLRKALCIGAWARLRISRGWGSLLGLMATSSHWHIQSQRAKERGGSWN